MGVMKTGWVKSGGKWYYMDKASGAMLYNTTKKIDGKVYYFNKDGICTNP
jgi:glucan-binding YG repeat protein